MRIYLLVIISLLFFFAGCTNGSDKSLVSNVEKLNSPDSQYTLYRYNVAPSTAFGSGSTRMTIQNAAKDFNYSTTDFFTTGDYGDIVLAWKNQTTLKLVSLTGGERSNTEPYKHETKQWKGFTIETAYYHMFSTLRNEFSFDAYTTQGDTITFSNSKENKSFIKGQVEISYDSSMFYIREIKITVDSTGKEAQKNKVLVSFFSWELKPTKQFDFSDFISSGVLIHKKIN